MSIATAPRARPLPLPVGLGIAARNLRAVKFLLPFIILIGIWWAVELAGNFPERVLVSPARVWDTLVVLSEHGVLAEYISTSLSMVGFATLISLAIGVPVGIGGHATGQIANAAGQQHHQNCQHGRRIDKWAHGHGTTSRVRGAKYRTRA